MSGVRDVWETEDMHSGLLVEKTFPKSLLGRPRLRWENNIKIGFQEVVGGHGLDASSSG